MEAFSSIITSLENWIWGAPMLILLCGTHIFMTLRTGFIQKKTFTGIRLSVTKDPDSPGDVSQFQALTTALASTIGTGNIIGVGTAIYLGGPGAVAGGLVGGGIRLALQYGVARGLFSNESGMGSAPLVASAAQTRNPVRQALVSATGTFWDTVVVCLMTGLVLVSTIMKNPNINMDTIENGGQMTTAAFSQIPYIGPAILVIGIITFAYSTILGWSYYGERAAEYLLGRKAILPYKVIFTAIVVLGPVLALDLVWTIADVLNALMAIPNLVAVLLLSGVIAKETRHYLANLDEKDTTEIPVVRR